MAFSFNPVMQIGRSDRIVIGSIAHSVHSKLDRGYLFVREDNPAHKIAYTYADLWEAARENRLKVERGAFSQSAARAQLQAGVDALADLDAEEQAKLLHRELWCQSFQTLYEQDRKSYPKTRTGFAKAIKALKSQIQDLLVQGALSSAPGPKNAVTAKSKSKSVRAGVKVETALPPTPSTLERWERRYEAGGRHILALRDGYRHCGGSSMQIPPRVRVLLHECADLYADERRWSKEDCYQELTVRIGQENLARVEQGLSPFKIPCKNTMIAAINRLDPYETFAARTDRSRAQKAYFVNSGGLEAEYPGARWEVDEFTLPLMSLVKKSGLWADLTPVEQEAIKSIGRVCVAVVLDVAPRVVMGLSLSRVACAENVLNALSMATRDKTPFARAFGVQAAADMHSGVDEVATDGGSSMVNGTVRAAIHGLGARHLIGPKGVPQMRGHIERFFGTLHTGLLSNFSGRTFHNSVAKGDYPAEERAVFDDDQVFQLIFRYIFDLYHVRPHAGLGGQMPIARWRDLMATRGAPPAPDADQRRVLFGIPLERPIGSHGLRILGSDYQHAALQDYRRRTQWLHDDGRKARRKDVVRTVEVRLDPFDLGAVSVRIGDMWITVPALDPSLVGIPLTVQVQTLTWLRERFGREAAVYADVVDAARRDIMAESASAIALSAFGVTRPSAAAIQNAEMSLGITLRARSEDAVESVSAAGREPSTLNIETGTSLTPGTPPVGPSPEPKLITPRSSLRKRP
ncbi:DDE-type integrase/transposase/recombinase [Methylobacterium sp. Leaf85]|uniref:DDE-type integrase/transposase/recombinase n=1 Tax=Methylobacterium sp. Leaf85 TaxID=1736241 RepID=UPI0006F89E47|nr:DDE-type integrase/transposase/recombinase [Methylobacterium sp. Leaf85]KQO53847.1 hypothetical protein ASF08_17100 [Methylobacterium sp. Leaf85]